MQMPVQPGSAVPKQWRLPARSLYDYTAQPKGPPVWAFRGEDVNSVPTATDETLREAREMAKRMEEEGIIAARKSGIIPKGPPSPPIGCMVIEQKYVDFIVGPGGQSLAALNYAAGVTVQLDQSRKFSGYTVAHIYGPEDCTRRAKVALEFKISQWLPKGVTYMMAAPIGAVNPVGEDTPPLHPSQQRGASSGATGGPAAGTSAVLKPNFAGVHLSAQGATGVSRSSTLPAGLGSAPPPPDAEEPRGPLPPEALANPLVQSLQKWPALARSAARASAAGSATGGVL